MEKNGINYSLMIWAFLSEFDPIIFSHILLVVSRDDSMRLVSN